MARLGLYWISCMAACVSACAAPTALETSDRPAPVVATPTGTYRLGAGTVESVALVETPRLGPPASASTGGSIPVRPFYRLVVRMDDGTAQSIDQESNDFIVGDRVRVTGSGRVIRP